MKPGDFNRARARLRGAKAAADKLAIAADSIREVATTLNDAGHRCSACGLNVKEDFEQAKMREQIESMADRLANFAARLRM